MGGFLRIVALFVVLVGAFVLVGLPLILGPILTQVVRNTGIQSQSLDVSVALFDPGLLTGHSRRVTLSATDVVQSPATIGSLNVSVSDASFFDRTFVTVSGEIDDVTLTTTQGDSAHLDRVTLDGPADAASATAHLSAADTEALIRLAGQRAGVTIDSVTVSASGVSVKISGAAATARLAVTAGALVLDPGVGSGIVLLQPAPSDPWQLQEAWVAADGLNVRATVDVTRLASSITGSS